MWLPLFVRMHGTRREQSVDGMYIKLRQKRTRGGRLWVVKCREQLDSDEKESLDQLLFTQKRQRSLSKTVTVSLGQHGTDLTLFYLYTHYRALLHARRFSPFFPPAFFFSLQLAGVVRAAGSCYTSITRYVFASSCSRCRSNLVYGRPRQRFKTQKSKTKKKKGKGARRIPPSAL